MMNLTPYFYNTKINQINNNLHLKQKVNKPILVQKSMAYAAMPSFAYQSLYCPNISFKGQVDKVDESIYSDTEKFAEYYEAKLKEKMHVKSEKDIQKVIDKTMEVTGADEKTVCEVISRLTQFSDYSHLEDLENSISKTGYNHLKMIGDFNINCPLYYLSNKKQQFLNNSDKLFSSDEQKSFFVVDNYFLDFCDGLDKESGEYWLAKGYMENAVIIDGWNKKGISHTIFGHNNNLLTSTLAVIFEMQSTGNALDEVLNGAVLERCKDIFGDDEDCIPKIVKSEKQVAQNAKAIADHLKPKMPTKEQIVNYVDVLEQNTELLSLWVDNLTPDDKKKLICKCLDEVFEPYSTERLNVAMKDMQKKIQEKVQGFGKTMEDVIYIVPYKEKSYSAIAYHYAMANDVPFDKFIIDDFAAAHWDTSLKPIEKGKVYVILDDIAGTGESLSSTMRCKNFVGLIDNDINTNLIWAPVYMTDMAQKRFDSKIFDYNRENSDTYICDVQASKPQVYEFFKQRNNPYDIDQFLGGCGYRGVATFVVFPFCISDTNARLASAFSSFFLRYPNQRVISEKITPAWLYTNTYETITKQLGSYNETNPQ